MTKNKKTNITHLNQYTSNKTLDNIRQVKRKKFVRIRTGIILACGIVMIGFAGLPLINNTQKTNEMNELYTEAATDFETLEEERKALEYQVGLLEDEEYVAKLARKELNLSQEHEILINLPEESRAQETTDLNEEENDLE